MTPSRLALQDWWRGCTPAPAGLFPREAHVQCPSPGRMEAMTLSGSFPGTWLTLPGPLPPDRRILAERAGGQRSPETGGQGCRAGPGLCREVPTCGIRKEPNKGTAWDGGREGSRLVWALVDKGGGSGALSQPRLVHVAVSTQRRNGQLGSWSGGGAGLAGWAGSCVPCARELGAHQSAASTCWPSRLHVPAGHCSV